MDDSTTSAGQIPEDGASTTQNPPKSFSVEYVKELREEARNNRLALGRTESVVRKALSIPDGEEIGNLEERILKLQSVATATANNKLILAELKGMQGYDHKLLQKVADFSKVSVTDDGTVTGLKEAVEAAAKEFPAVKLVGGAQGILPQNPPTDGANSAIPAENRRMNDLIRRKR